MVADVDGQVAGTLQLPARASGRLLIGWAIEEARRGGCGRVQLTSDKRRPEAIRCYEGLGFTLTHEGFRLSL
jgi:GNAT superfamily N-acetyltransferase